MVCCLCVSHVSHHDCWGAAGPAPPPAGPAVNTHTAAGFQAVLVRRSDMAFVIFSSASQAAAALKRMSGTKVSGGGGGGGGSGSVDSR